MSYDFPKFNELMSELEAWPATGRGDGLDAAVVGRLMKRASYAIHRLQLELERARGASSSDGSSHDPAVSSSSGQRT